MSYFPDGMPEPFLGPEDAPFWEACQRQELRIQQCSQCETFRHPPAPICPKCRSMESHWHQVSGDGEVFSYTIAYHAVHPAQRGHPGYNIVLVLLDGAGDVRLVSNLMDVKPEDLAIGMRVRLKWDQISDGQYLPRFTRADLETADA